MRLFEEAEMLDEVEESGEIVTDPAIVTKLYERYQKNLQETKGAAQNDLLDLIELNDQLDWMQFYEDEE